MKIAQLLDIQIIELIKEVFAECIQMTALKNAPFFDIEYPERKQR